MTEVLKVFLWGQEIGRLAWHDAWGNMLFEQWRKDNRLTERNVTSIEKLAFIGKRGMGALEFLRPSGSKRAELERVPEIKRVSMTGQIDIKAWGEWQEDAAMP